MKVTRTYVPIAHGIELVHTVTIGGRTLEARVRISDFDTRSEMMSKAMYGQGTMLHVADRELQRKVMRTIEKELYPE